MEPAPTPPPPAAGPRLAHLGRGGELFAITLVNLLLKLVTLGIYHFWGKTRVRRYVWSHTHFAGEPFEYTGRGLELFLGYLIAMAVLVPLLAGWNYLLPLFQENELVMVPGLVGFYVVFLFLAGFATYSATRYKLSRTRWRGVRFGLSGSRSRHGLLLVVHTLATVLTLGLYWPVMRNRLTHHLFNNAWMGNLRFRYDGRGRDLFVRFLVVAVLALLMMALLFGLIVLAGRNLLPLQEMEQSPLTVFVLAAGFYIPLLVGWLLIGLWYLAIEYRYIAAHTFLENVGFSLDFTTGQFLRLIVVNFVLMALTVSLAFPWVVVRTARFAASHLSLHGELDLEAIAQHPEGVPATGEGLAEAFDLGSI